MILRRYVWSLPLALLCMGSCTLDNPAFDESRQTAADKGDDESGVTGPESDSGNGDGDGDTDPGDGDADTNMSGDGDGDGDADTSTDGDGDGDTDTGDGDPDTSTSGDGDGDGNVCEGLAHDPCAQTNGCEPVNYVLLEMTQNDEYCLGDAVYEGCIPTPECQLSINFSYWCNLQLQTFIKVPANSCLPSYIEEMFLDPCDPPNNVPADCP